MKIVLTTEQRQCYWTISVSIIISGTAIYMNKKCFGFQMHLSYRWFISDRPTDFVKSHIDHFIDFDSLLSWHTSTYPFSGEEAVFQYFQIALKNLLKLHFTCTSLVMIADSKPSLFLKIQKNFHYPVWSHADPPSNGSPALTCEGMFWTSNIPLSHSKAQFLKKSPYYGAKPSITVPEATLCRVIVAFQFPYRFIPGHAFSPGLGALGLSCLHCLVVMIFSITIVFPSFLCFGVSQ